MCPLNLHCCVALNQVFSYDATVMITALPLASWVISGELQASQFLMCIVEIKMTTL